MWRLRAMVVVVVLLVLLSDGDCHAGELLHDSRKLGCRGVITLTEAARASLHDGGDIGLQALDLGVAPGDGSMQFGNDLLKSVARRFVHQTHDQRHGSNRVARAKPDSTQHGNEQSNATRGGKAFNFRC
jgi:hypothetical protein